VLVAKGDGRFEPRDVKAGARGDGFTAIREGLKEGEEVVTEAAFLIDAESNLRAALQSIAPTAPELKP
jgi:Cu(I)/Ag(I) efflux system membrane fusion protein